jgi:hypothetical protein
LVLSLARDYFFVIFFAVVAHGPESFFPIFLVVLAEILFSSFTGVQVFQLGEKRMKRKGGREEGRKGGREEGRKGGREEGRKRGREEGRKGGKEEEERGREGEERREGKREKEKEKQRKREKKEGGRRGERKTGEGRKKGEGREVLSEHLPSEILARPHSSVLERGSHKDDVVDILLGVSGGAVSCTLLHSLVPSESPASTSGPVNFFLVHIRNFQKEKSFRNFFSLRAKVQNRLRRSRGKASFLPPSSHLPRSFLPPSSHLPRSFLPLPPPLAPTPLHVLF